MGSGISFESKNKGTGHLRQVAIIGLVLSLSLGFFDLLINVLFRPSGLSSLKFVTITFIPTVVFSFLIYIILVASIIPLLRHWFNIEILPCALASAFFLGTSLILIKLDDNFMIFSPFRVYDLIKLFIPYMFFIVALIFIYFAMKNIIHSRYKNTAMAFGLIIPLIIAETMIFIWLHQYKIDNLFSTGSYLLNIIYISCVLITLGIPFYLSRTPTIIKIFKQSIIIIIFIPFVIFIALRTMNQHKTKNYSNQGHEIKKIILITVDTLRSDVLSCYGQQNLYTPHMDRLAKEGILFKKAFSASPWTLTSISSIMTGLSPFVHMTKNRDSKLPDSLKTLAEYLGEDGYFTGAIGANSFLTKEFNLSQGFLEYNFFNPLPNMNKSVMVNLIRKLVFKLFHLSFASSSSNSTQNITDLTTSWLKSHGGKDFFLWIHYFEPHLGYDPPAECLPENLEPVSTIGTNFSRLKEIRGGYFVPTSDERKWIKVLYDGEVKYVDIHMGIVLETLDRLNLYDESLIIFTSDHGEEFWEHGGFEHGHSLYNELLQVPLIVKLPHSYSKGRIITQEVSTQSIMPTILDLCRIGYDVDYLSSDSLSPLWDSNPIDFSFKKQPIISTGLLYYEDRESIIFNGLKYIYTPFTGREQLYDLTSDPEEKISILFSSRNKAREMQDSLREYKDKCTALKRYYHLEGKEKIELDKGTIQRLRSLGYVQ